jgi:hypothetical protein
MPRPTEWTPAADGDDGSVATLVPLAPGDAEWLFAAELVRASCPAARLVSVNRVQWLRVWEDYERHRDREFAGRDANERLLFHGACALSAKEVLAHPKGLDPAFSSGGFYGRGVYLAEDPGYQIGGRYAHFVSGHSGRRLQLILVRAALGVQQEMRTRINPETQKMTMPGVRSDGPPRVLYDSVRAGPHRPFQSGTGESGLNASIIHVVYERLQLYPQYVIEFDLDVDPAVLACTQAAGSEPSSSSAAGSGRSSSAPPAKRPRPGPPPAGGGGGPSSSGAAQNVVPAALPSPDEVVAMVRSLERHVRSGPSSRNRASNAIAHLANMFARAHAAGNLRHNLQPLQQAAADAGVFEAVVAAMRSAPDVPIMQTHGCCFMHIMCIRSDGDGDANTWRDRAAQAGAIEAAVEAMRLYPQEEQMQAWACGFLAMLAAEHRDYSGSALVRARRIVAANAVALVEAALASFPQNQMLQSLAVSARLLGALRHAAAAP